jgi:hypothetical protein
MVGANFGLKRLDSVAFKITLPHFFLFSQHSAYQDESLFFGATTFSITTLSITALNMKGLCAKLSITTLCHYVVIFCYTECRFAE